MTNKDPIAILDVMTPEEGALWYQKKSKHFDPDSRKLATGLPGKAGRYKVNVMGQTYWIFYSLLYSPSRAYKFTTNGQILARREYIEGQGIMMIASDLEPLYIRDHYLVLPSGYRQKVRLSYCLFEDLNILRFKQRKDNES